MWQSALSYQGLLRFVNPLSHYEGERVGVGKGLFTPLFYVENGKMRTIG